MSFPIVIVSGPTACGKTDLVHQLANPDKDIIINCDSRLFFRHLNIGTAKPNSELLDRYHYRLVDFLNPGELFSVHDFLHSCIDEVEKIKQNTNISGRKIFLVGGSMFYAEVLKQGLPVFPPISPEIKSHLQKLWEEKGLNYLTEILKKKDPDFFEEVDLNNPRRVIRALEIIESGGKFSELRQKRQPPPWNYLEIIPILPREIIYQRIEDRVVKMMESGWVDEVREILKQFSPEKINKCSAIGYSEIIDLINTKFNYKDTIIRIQQKTRQMAKRQITWIKKDASGYLVFNPKSGYNISAMFDKKTLSFINPIDTWMNRYPRYISSINESLPSLLISENPLSFLKKKIGGLYE